jgi:hypothetical protein
MNFDTQAQDGSRRESQERSNIFVSLAQDKLSMEPPNAAMVTPIVCPILPSGIIEADSPAGCLLNGVTGPYPGPAAQNAQSGQSLQNCDFPAWSPRGHYDGSVYTTRNTRQHSITPQAFEASFTSLSDLGTGPRVVVRSRREWLSI